MPDVRTGLSYGSISGPKTRPRKFAQVTLPLTSRHPDEEGVRIIGGFKTYYDQSPVAEGEALMWIEQSGQFDFFPHLYIAVDVNQTGNVDDLEWIEVDLPAGQQVGGVLDAPQQVVVLPTTDFNAPTP